MAVSNMLEVKDLKVHFPVKRNLLGVPQVWAKAVDGVSFSIAGGETLGVVGESGCGKSTVARAVLKLIPSTDGSVVFDGVDMDRLRPAELRTMRRNAQIVFQDPYSSLDQRLTAGAAIKEPLAIHGIARGSEADRKVDELLDVVGLQRSAKSRYPHEFSGGQRQRIAIARALAVSPRFVVCDEPISALDVSVQAQIINLLIDLQKSLSITYLFIAHDLAVVRYISNRVAVMYLGRIVEIGAAETLYSRPRHPYTRSLIAASPGIDPRQERAKKHLALEGEIPSPLNPPSGCSFHTRCRFAKERCRVERPELEGSAEGHGVACHFWPEIEAAHG
jgi:oligopeptide/dipeptide ABC transporter ATP-binding protein